ncbi:putative metal-dependent phosphohydrolase [Skeletonema marinoi]|uniref:Metal-dependent phosphohydrolase n=1 Tax=Skeletonema marinoi TaxID=267567 RepID=A0AAD8XVX7_9STRA|nr:putative metal-dependent phosphohydrolase [Skeletonema marinoi]
MMMEQSLRNRWKPSVTCLINELGMSSSSTITIDRERLQELDALSQSWLEKISQLYAEPHRAYHNMTHVQDVIASLDFLLDGEDSSIDAHTTCEKAILILAAFFHDVIYNPKSSTNEKDSADLFLQFASELGYQRDDNDEQPCTQQHIRNCIMVMQIEECIIATATHISSAGIAHETQNHTLATFLDADMSILGKDVEIYDKYAGCIRREYEFRADILESFLPILDEDAASTTATTPVKKHSFIYATDKGRLQWEEQARSNLKNEIEMLRRGVIPCEIQKHG